MEQPVRFPTEESSAERSTIAVLTGDDPAISQRLYEITMQANDGHSTWKPNSFQQELLADRSLYLGSFLGEELVGYIGAMAVLDEASINNFAVLPAYQSRGRGAALMRELLFQCQERGIRSVWLEVRVSNQPARRLYRKLGFQEIAMRKDYYTDPVEDACLMQCLVPTEKKKEVKP